MSERIAIPLPDGRWIVLEAAVLHDALQAGAALFGQPATQRKNDGEPWLKAAELAPLLNVPQSRLEAGARHGRIPAMRIGRYWRFQRGAVERALSTDNCAP